MTKMVLLDGLKQTINNRSGQKFRFMGEMKNSVKIVKI